MTAVATCLQCACNGTNVIWSSGRSPRRAWHGIGYAVLRTAQWPVTRGCALYTLYTTSFSSSIKRDVLVSETALCTRHKLPDACRKVAYTDDLHACPAAGRPPLTLGSYASVTRVSSQPTQITLVYSIRVSQGSVATRFGSGGISNDSFTAQIFQRVCQ